MGGYGYPTRTKLPAASVGERYDHDFHTPVHVRNVYREDKVGWVRLHLVIRQFSKANFHVKKTTRFRPTVQCL